MPNHPESPASPAPADPGQVASTEVIPPTTGIAPVDLALLTSRSTLPIELRRASGMQKLDWIWSLANPAEFVAELEPQELYYWIRDIGKNDAYPLLEHATPEQLRALVDIDAWAKHEPQLPRILEWLDLALAVDHDTATRFLESNDDELLLWLMSGEVEVLPSDTDIDFVPDDRAVFHSPDRMYVVTCPREHPLEERLPQIMKLLWAGDIDRVRRIFQQVQFELPTSLLDDAERFRSARLQDLGFEPPTDALGVFATLDVNELRRALRTDTLGVQAPAQAPHQHSPDLVLRDATPPELLRVALERLAPTDRAVVGERFAYLVNKVFMAETGDLSRVDDLPAYARQAAAEANLGLQHLSDDSAEQAAKILASTSAETIFRAGHTLIMQVAQKARRLSKRAGAHLGFGLFGMPFDGVIAGAALTRPLFWEGVDDERQLTYRPFTTLDDLARTEAYIAEATALLDWFEAAFGFAIDRLATGPLEYLSGDARRRIRLATLFRTGLAHALLAESFSFAPLSEAELVTFARAAFGRDGTPTAALTTTLERARSADATVGRFVERTLDALTDAMAGVAPTDLDARYAGELFILAKPTPGAAPGPFDA